MRRAKPMEYAITLQQAAEHLFREVYIHLLNVTNSGTDWRCIMPARGFTSKRRGLLSLPAGMDFRIS